MKGIYIVCAVVFSVLQATESKRAAYSECPCPTPSPGYPECPEKDIPQKPPVWVEIPNDCNHFILFDNYSIGHYESCPLNNPPLVFEINKGCMPKDQSIRTDCCPTGPTTLPPTDITEGSTTTPEEGTGTTSPNTPSLTPTDEPTTTAPPETPSPTPTEGPTTTASPETPSPTPTEIPSSSPEIPTTTDSEATTPNYGGSPCRNVTATSDEVRIKNYPGCPQGPLDPTQFRIHLEIASDCNHFIQCDNYGVGVCKVCAPSPSRPLVFDKSVNDQECSWPWDSRRRDC